jgi:hypothetical protein
MINARQRLDDRGDAVADAASAENASSNLTSSAALLADDR